MRMIVVQGMVVNWRNIPIALIYRESKYFSLRCSVTSLLLSRHQVYGSQLEAELFDRGRQALDAPLATAVFRCCCAFVDVGLAPSQQPVNQSSQLPSGCEHGNVSTGPLRQLAIVCSQGGVAVA